jgi:hypothetical protein
MTQPGVNPSVRRSVMAALPASGPVFPVGFPLTDLVFYFPLDETGGTRTDAHAGLTLTDNNTVTQNPGKLGSAAQFTRANNEWLQAADTDPVSHGDFDFTYQAWVYLDSDPGGGNSLTMVNKNQTPLDSNGDWEMLFRIAGSTRLATFGLGDSAATLTMVTASTFGALNLATWYHILAWHDSVGNTINLQINNSAVQSAACTHGSFNGNGVLKVGGSDNGADRYDGRIDALARWNRVLTAQERTDLYGGGAGFGP